MSLTFEDCGDGESFGYGAQSRDVGFVDGIGWGFGLDSELADWTLLEGTGHGRGENSAGDGSTGDGYGSKFGDGNEIPFALEVLYDAVSLADSTIKFGQSRASEAW